MTAPRIRTLLLADWAEAIDGKLYVMGGGFAAIALTGATHRCALAAIVELPAGLASQPVPMSARIEDASGQPAGSWRLEGELTADPEGLGGDADAVVTMAGPVEIQVSEPGRYRVRVRFGDTEGEVGFRVVARDG